MKKMSDLYKKAIVLLPSELAMTVAMLTSVNCVNENKTNKLGQPTSTVNHIVIAPRKIPIIIIASVDSAVGIPRYWKPNKKKQPIIKPIYFFIYIPQIKKGRYCYRP